MSIAAFVAVALLTVLAAVNVTLAKSAGRQLVALSVTGALLALLVGLDGSLRLSLLIGAVVIVTGLLIWRGDPHAWKSLRLHLIVPSAEQAVPLLASIATVALLIGLLLSPLTFFSHPPVNVPSQSGYLYSGFVYWLVLLVLLAVVSGLAVFKLASVDEAEQAHAKATEIRRRHRDQRMRRRQARLASQDESSQPEDVT